MTRQVKNDLLKIMQFCLKENITLSMRDLGMAFLVAHIAAHAEQNVDSQAAAQTLVDEIFASILASVYATLEHNDPTPRSGAIN